MKNAEISRIEIEKAGDNVRVIIHTGRPGVVIGKKGQEIESLKLELAKLVNRKNVEVSVQEVKNPEMDAVLVAKNIAEQFVKRGSFKKAMKRAAISAMKSGAKGIKICCAGRLKVQKLLVKNGRVLVLFHYIHFDQMLIMALLKHKPHMVLLVSKCGFVKANFNMRNSYYMED